MTHKELKRLSRAELLELLLIQTRETEKLRGQLEAAHQKLQDRQIAIEESGDLAQAVLAVNGVMEAANAAAQQYLLNMEAMEAETRARCEKMLEEARAEAELIRNAALEDLPPDGQKKREEEKTLNEHLQEAMLLLSEE
jgi:hypothetical protein